MDSIMTIDLPNLSIVFSRICQSCFTESNGGTDGGIRASCTPASSRLEWRCRTIGNDGFFARQARTEFGGYLAMPADSIPLSRLPLAAIVCCHSHSIVAGGFGVTS